MIRLAGSPALSGTEVLLSKNLLLSPPLSFTIWQTNLLLVWTPYRETMLGRNQAWFQILTRPRNTPPHIKYAKTILGKWRMPLCIFLGFNQFQTGKFWQIVSSCTSGRGSNWFCCNSINSRKLAARPGWREGLFAFFLTFSNSQEDWTKVGSRGNRLAVDNI